MNPRVKSVAALPEHKLKIEFNNGEVGVYDCSHLLDFGVFKELRDESYFKMAKASDGTVVWPHEQDICPDTLYLNSNKYAERIRLDRESEANHDLNRLLDKPGDLPGTP
jgi:hypothetical protein